MGIWELRFLEVNLDMLTGGFTFDSLSEPSQIDRFRILLLFMSHESTIIVFSNFRTLSK